MKMLNPIILKFMRGSTVEKEVIIDLFIRSGSRDFMFGQDRDILVRSAIKPLWWSFLESRLNDKFTNEEQTVLFSSHNGELIHIKRLLRILKRERINQDELLVKKSHSLAKGFFKNKNKILNNSSGLHVVLKLMSKSSENYLSKDSFINKSFYSYINTTLTKPSIRDLSGIDEDGLVAPTFCISVFAKLFDRAVWESQISKKVNDNPYLYGGRNRIDTTLNSLGSDFFCKEGAEGFLAFTLNSSERKYGAIKIRSGSCDETLLYLMKQILKNNKKILLSNRVSNKVSLCFDEISYRDLCRIY